MKPKNITNLDYVTAIPNAYFRKLYTFFIIFFLVKNWYDILLLSFHFKKIVKIRFKSGISYEISEFDTYHEFWHIFESEFFKLKYKDKIKINENFVIFNFRGKMLNFFYNSHNQLSDTIRAIAHQFFLGGCAWLNVREKEVVDIGAYVGDSAIYFALKGAKHIYAFEPYPSSFNLAEKNVSANKLNKKITIINKGCGGKLKVIRINKMFESSMHSRLKSFRKGKKTEILTLKNILERYQLSNPVLKVDCQGCEYDLLLNSSNDVLREFSEILVEFHNGCTDLEEKFKDAGFKVKTSLLVDLSEVYENKQNVCLGVLLASLKN